MADLARAMQTPPPLYPAPVAQATIAKKKRRKPKKAAVVKAAPRKRRKKKAAKAVPAASRRGRRSETALELPAAMALLGSLHRTDVPVFQVLTEALSARGKPSRKRLLAALGRVFG